MTKKPDLEALISESIGNIRADRKKANRLVDGLMKVFNHNKDIAVDKDVATAAAKYMESLARSNEQLVKLISLEKKTTKTDESVSKDEVEEVYGEEEN